MKHGLKGPFVKLTFVQTMFGNLEKRLPDLGMTGYKNLGGEEAVERSLGDAHGTGRWS